MYAARKHAFADQLGLGCVIDGAYELDGFDSLASTYLILSADNGAHLGSVRLLPPMAAAALDRSQDFVWRTPPQALPGPAAITRFCIDPSLTGAERRRVRDTLFAALAEHALARGVPGYLAVISQTLARTLSNVGVPCRVVGMPDRSDGDGPVAIEISVGSAIMSQLLLAGIRPEYRLTARLRIGL